MIEQLIKPKSLGGFVRSLSGLFISKDNPSGITPKECTVIAVMLGIARDNFLSKEIKIEVSNQLNQSLQVTINYINKFKKKGVITEDDKLHSVFFKKVIIDGTDILQ